jgi:fatty-acyl-CoA synthase
MFERDLLSERARVTPGRTALVLVESGERLTYAQLDARAEAAAGTLAARGIVAGDRFGVLAYNCVEFLELFFGAMKCGAIVVPLSTRATARELSQIAADCAMKALFYGDEFAAIAAEVSAVRYRASEREAATGDPGSATSDPRYATSDPQFDDETIACLLYTSGTTGKPKGVMIPRRQLLWNGMNTVVNWSLRDDDITPIYTPLYHAGGVAAFLIPLFTAGGTIVLHKSFDPAEVWRTVERERCTIVLGVPTTWKLLMDAPEFATAKLDHVRWFISGGAPLPAYIAEAYRRRGIVMKQGYGMTEVGVNCFTMTVEESVSKAGSIGKPLLYTELRIVDSGGNDVAAGEVGEMWLRGPHVSKGYWNNPDATAATFREDGFLRTGDLARRDEDGFVYIAGRAKEMFISGGVNVYPAEIEAELVSHPAVADAAVVPVVDETWGEVAVAFVVSGATVEELSLYLSTRIARFKLPKQYIFLDALPRTPYGKVEKGKLRDTLSKGPSAG